MEKINFNQVRGFSDSITLTFNFIKQEFKPLLRSFAVIALPVIFIGLFFMSYSARESLIAIVQPDQYAGSPLDQSFDDGDLFLDGADRYRLYSCLSG